MTEGPKLVDTPADLRAEVRALRAGGSRIALVPTMGALHEGHLALVRQAKALADAVIVSIFVNPTQFAPNEDFSRYPRTLERDLDLLKGEGANFAYVPAASDMYPAGFSTRIVPAGPAEGLESDFRPHFFSGVTLVVAKLFLQSGADVAIFGEKDYQQLKVVTRMARDLDIPIEIVPGTTVREADGLALSSRNRYLTPEERAVAPVISRALRAAGDAIRAGSAPQDAAGQARAMITEAGLKVDYVEARHAETLAPPIAGDPIRLLAAAWLGKTRLIDNLPA